MAIFAEVNENERIIDRHLRAARYTSTALSTGGTVFNTLVWGEPLKSEPRNLVSRN